MQNKAMKYALGGRLSSDSSLEPMRINFQRLQYRGTPVRIASDNCTNPTLLNISATIRDLVRCYVPTQYSNNTRIKHGS